MSNTKPITVNMPWPGAVHLCYNLINFRLSQFKPLIDAEGGEDLNMGMFLKTPLISGVYI